MFVNKAVIMRKCPKISIVIPAYNREDIICETLDSIVSQT